MDWGRARFFLTEVYRSFTRNTLMQITAIGTVAVTIVLLGSFLYVREAATRIGDDVLRKIEISVFLDDRADDAAAKALVLRVQQDPRVESVTFVSKVQGLRELRARLRGQIDTSLLTSNPLPDALRVKTRRPEQVAVVADAIRSMPSVANVVYAQETVLRLLRIGELFARIGLVVVAILIGIAAILISNTIRLTVLARRREIAIMQLVGASNAYVQLPFILEGLLDGLAGSALALGVLVLARHELMPRLAAALPFVPLGAATFNELSTALTLLSVGTLVGIGASWYSVGRYLRT